MAVSLSGLGLGLQNSGRVKFKAFVDDSVQHCHCLCQCFFIGLGPITWVYSSEIFPLRLRAQGSSLVISGKGLVSGVVSMTFLTISKKITFGGVFFVMMMTTTFFYVFMPETKGKTLEEMETLFEDSDCLVEVVLDSDLPSSGTCYCVYDLRH
ncbi:putative polyol transporter 6 [Glycine soja]|uniref:Putative polyol transporter 6 n=1 Tax=Glycine soja TaxID=3848 RepID=A0A445KSK3_GLYSO|nr:putative polyol transporter 6 [Glycine soja]